MTVVNEKTLSVVDGKNATRTTTGNQLGTIVRWALRNRVWEATRRIVVTVKNVDDGVASFLPGETRPDQRSDIGMVDPGFNNRRTDRMCDNDRIVIVVRNSRNEVVSIAPQGQVLAIGKLMPYAWMKGSATDRSPWLPSTVM